MLHSKANKIDVYDLAQSVVDIYRDYLRKNKDQVLLDFKNEGESAIELVCKIESIRHMSRREVDLLKTRIHRLLPMCGHVWIVQKNKNGKWLAEVVADFDPALVRFV